MQQGSILLCSKFVCTDIPVEEEEVVAKSVGAGSSRSEHCHGLRNLPALPTFDEHENLVDESVVVDDDDDWKMRSKHCPNQLAGPIWKLTTTKTSLIYYIFLYFSVLKDNLFLFFFLYFFSKNTVDYDLVIWSVM